MAHYTNNGGGKVTCITYGESLGHADMLEEKVTDALRDLQGGLIFLQTGGVATDRARALLDSKTEGFALHDNGVSTHPDTGKLENCILYTGSAEDALRAAEKSAVLVRTKGQWQHFGAEPESPEKPPAKTR